MPEIYEMAGHLIRRLNQISVSVFADRMAREGHELTSVQFAALTLIEVDPGIDQATLAGAIAYDRATIGGVVDRLQHKGLIERTVSRTDRRARSLCLTDKGRQLIDEVRPIVWDLQKDILAGLDPSEQRELLALLKKATDAGNALARAPLRTRDRGEKAKVL